MLDWPERMKTLIGLPAASDSPASKRDKANVNRNIAPLKKSDRIEKKFSIKDC
jgi:hypothetical protein